MRQPPDRVTLDRMVSGRDAPEDPEDIAAWDDLLASPTGTEAWAEAVERRRTIDQLASRARMWPWLAPFLVAGRRLARRAGASTISLKVEGPLLAAVLGPGAGPRTLEVGRGGTEIVEVTLGERVRVEAPNGGCVLYRSARAEGVLRGGWRMEAGDAPVLLVITEDATAGSVDEALASGRVRAIVVLVLPSGENGA